MSAVTQRRKSLFVKDIAQLRQDPVVAISLIIVVLLLATFVLYPLFKVLALSLMPAGKLSLNEFVHVLRQPALRKSFTNSIILGVTTATISTIIGYIFAFALNRTDMPGGRFFRPIALLPLVSPPFMFTLSVLLLFGRNGLITKNLLKIAGANIYGFKGLVLVQTINRFPIAFMALEGVLRSLGSDLEEASKNLGATSFKTFRSITLPLSLPGITSSWLLLFVSSLADFGNPLVLGGRFTVLSVQAYLQFTGMFNVPRGAVLCVLLLLPSVTAFATQRYLIGRKSYVTVTGKPQSADSKKVNSFLRYALFSVCLFISVVVLSLYFTVIVGAFVKRWGVDFSFSFEHWTYIWSRAVNSFRSTLNLALFAAPISALLGIFIAFLLVRKEFRGRSLLGFVAMLSYAVPGTVVGIGYVSAFNERPLLLTGTGLIIVICFIFRFMPVSLEAGMAQLVQIDKSIEEASTNLGASTGRTFRSITLPLVKPAFAAGLSLSFTRCMTAISAIIFLVSGRWQHITVLILAQTEYMNLGAASVLSLMLIVIILSGFGLIRLVLGTDKRNRRFLGGIS